MFNRNLKKKIKELEQKVKEMDTMLTEIIADIDNRVSTNSEAIDLLADEMGAEIKECDCCGRLVLDFDNE